MTPSIDKTLHQFANLLPNWTLLLFLTLLPNFGGCHRTLQRVRLANRGRLLLRTPGPVPFGTYICSNVQTILSWTCHVYGPFEFRTSLGTPILLVEIFLTSLKVLNRICRNLTGGKIVVYQVLFGKMGKQDGRPCLWFVETFSTSSLKPLNLIWRNLTGSKIKKLKFFY